MTLPAWPAALPEPSRDSYGYDLPELNQRTPFALGSRVRPLFSDGPDTFSSLNWVGTADQVTRYKGFFRYELLNGASWFTCRLRVASVCAEYEVRIIAPPSIDLIQGTNYWRVRMPVETRTGTTVTREEYEDILDGLDFDGYTRTLLVPSDTALIAEYPLAGIYLPLGARVALEGVDGSVATLDLPADCWFTGMVPRRLLARHTDVDAVVYGLTHPSITALPDYSGDRVITVAPSASTDLSQRAVGGVYLPFGGLLDYRTAAGAASATLRPAAWFRPAAITRVLPTSDASPVLAFVRADLTPRALALGLGGLPLLLAGDGASIEFANAS